MKTKYEKLVYIYTDSIKKEYTIKNKGHSLLI